MRQGSPFICFRKKSFGDSWAVLYIRRRDSSRLEGKRDIVAQKSLWKRFRNNTEGHETAGCYVQGDWKKWKDLEITIYSRSLVRLRTQDMFYHPLASGERRIRGGGKGGMPFR